MWMYKVVSSRRQSVRSWKWSLTDDNKPEDEEQRKERSRFCPSKNVYNSDDTITWRARPETKRTFVSHSRLMWSLHRDDVKKTWKWRGLKRGEEGFYSSREIYKWVINARRDSWHPSWPPQYDITSHPLRRLPARMYKNVSLVLSEGESGGGTVALKSGSSSNGYTHSYSMYQQFLARHQLEKVPH